jgi:hypothetical protein
VTIVVDVDKISRLVRAPGVGLGWIADLHRSHGGMESFAPIQTFPPPPLGTGSFDYA